MNILRSISISAGLLMTVMAAAQNNTTINAPLSLEGKQIILIDFDNGEPIDSAVITNGSVRFQSERLPERYASVIVDGNTITGIFLDNSEITASISEDIPGRHPYSLTASGGLNDRFNSISTDLTYKIRSMRQQGYNFSNMRHTLRPQLLEAIENNATNPVGYVMAFMGSDILGDDIIGLAKKYPAIGESRKISRIIAKKNGLANSQPGKKFTNFTVSYDGVSHSLDEVVGKGHHVLVDFWASWCGPCRREMSFIKRAMEEFSDKGLEILGIAVWDDPQNSIQAARQMKLTWPIWFNGTEEITDLYGITGIPAIILFGPDGKILARDLHGEEILTTIAKYLH